MNIDLKKPQKGKPSNFIQADAHHLPFKSDVFDETKFFDVVEHIDNQSMCLKEMLRVLRSNGKLELNTPNVLHWRSFLRVARGKRLELCTTEHIVCWTHIELENLLTNIGFRILDLQYLILHTTERDDSRKHIALDKLAYRLFPKFMRGVTARSLHVIAVKT